MSLFYNITGSTGVTVELIAPDEVDDILSILLTNVHATADATVTLFIQDDPASGTTSTYNIIHTIIVATQLTKIGNSTLIQTSPARCANGLSV